MWQIIKFEPFEFVQKVENIARKASILTKEQESAIIDCNCGGMPEVCLAPNGRRRKKIKAESHDMRRVSVYKH